jgi:predicted RNA-binding protein with PIN domain
MPEPPAPRPLIVVDAANVIGSRPDGWWRDRAGAARRLLSRLARSDLKNRGEVVVVLEGVARRAAPPGVQDGIRVDHAPRSGDDRIVQVVAETAQADPARPITVVTADRGLRARVTAHGARVLGPRSLWEQLEREP